MILLCIHMVLRGVYFSISVLTIARPQLPTKFINITTSIPISRFVARVSRTIRALAVQAGLVLLACVFLVLVVATVAISLVVAAAARSVHIPSTPAPASPAVPVLVLAVIIGLAKVTLIVSCLEARAKGAIITISHARSIWRIVIILADIP
jgi:hypothetical protein